MLPLLWSCQVAGWQQQRGPVIAPNTRPWNNLHSAHWAYLLHTQHLHYIAQWACSGGKYVSIRILLTHKYLFCHCLRWWLSIAVAAAHCWAEQETAQILESWFQRGGHGGAGSCGGHSFLTFLIYGSQCSAVHHPAPLAICGNIHSGFRPNIGSSPLLLFTTQYQAEVFLAVIVGNA